MAELKFIVSIDSSQFKAGAQEVKAQVKQITEEVKTEGAKMQKEFDKTGQSMQNSMKKYLAAFSGGALIKEFITQMGRVRGEFQKTEIAFETMLKSKDKADALMQQLIHTAAITPFGVSDVTDAAKQLLAYNTAAEEVNDTIIQLGDIAAGMGVRINDMVMLYGTTIAKGKMDTMDLRQFLNRGIPIADELAKIMGLDVKNAINDVGEAIKKGAVTADIFKQAVMSLADTKFEGLMEAQSHTILGQISNIEDAIEQMFNKIGQSQEGIISDALGGVSWVVEHYEAIGKAILPVIAAFGAYKAAVLAVWAVEKIVAIGESVKGFFELARGIKSAKDAMIALNLTFSANSIGMIAAAIAAAVTAFHLFKSEANEAAVMSQKFGESAARSISKINTLTTTLKGLTKGSSTYKKAVNELNGILEEFGVAQLKESDNIDAINEKREQAIELIKREAIERQRANALDTGEEKYANAIANAKQKLNEELSQAMSGGTGAINWVSGNDEIRENADAIATIIGDVVESNILKIAGKTGEEYEKGLNEIFDIINQRMRAIGISEKTIQEQWLTDGLFNHKNIVDGFIDTLRVAEEQHESYKDKIEKSAEAERQAAEATMTFEERVAATASSLEGVSDDVHQLYNNIRDLMSKYSENTIGFKITFSGEVPNWMHKMPTDEIKKLAKNFSSLGNTLAQDKKTGAYVNGTYMTTQQILQRGADYAQALENRQKATDKANREAKEKQEEREKAAKAAAKKAASESKRQAAEAQRQAEDAASRRQRTFDSQRKQEEQNHEQLLAARNAQTEAIIAQKEKSTDREIAQEEYDYERRKQEIDKQEREYRKANYDADKEKWELTNKNKTKVYSDTPEGKRAYEEVKLTKEQEEEIAALRAKNDAEKKRKDKEREESEKEAMRNYLKEYGDYQQKRAAIEEEYDKKEASTKGDKLIYEEQKKAALDQLARDFGLKSQQMADLFEDASEKSVKAIDGIIKKYEALVQFMKGANKEGEQVITRDDLLKLGFSDEDIKKVQTGEIKIKDITDAIKTLRKEVEGKSPLKAFTSDIEKAITKIKAGKLVEGLDSITQAVSRFAPTIKTLTSSISSAFGGNDMDTEGILGILDAIPQLVSGVVETIQDNAVTGMEKVSQSLLQLSTSIKKIKDDEDAFKDWERLKNITESLVGVFDDLIDKKKEFLSQSVGSDTLKTEEEVTELIEKQAEAWRELGIERLKAGADKNHHSVGYRLMRDMTKEAMEAASEALGGDARSILGKTAHGLFDLTAEQLQRLKEQAPQFWSRIDKDVQEYLQNIIDGAERLEDVQELVKEQLTRTTFDDVKNDFISKLSDMESAAADFSDDFSNMLFTAMLNTKIDELFSERLNDWYDSFANSMKDSELSQSERDALQNEYNAIVEDALQLRDALAEATGYGKSSGEGSGAYKAVSSFSQEQGDELNGRLTAIQIGQAQSNQSLLLAVTTLQGLSVVMTASGTALSEMRNLMLIGNGHLEDIARYTRLTSQNSALLEEIATKIKTL